MVAEPAQAFRCLELPSAEDIFGRTPGMREIQNEIDRAMQDDLPILIEGENGTGKEVIGRFLHAHSARKEGPFVKVSCGAVSGRVLEGEVFGYETGSTGNPGESRSGSIEMAAGGTLFVDDIADMDVSLQQRLIRTLKMSRYGRQNGAEDLMVEARFVCATGIDPQGGPRSQTVHADLLECFGHRVRLLPLRERKEDIPQLCRYLGEKFARNFGRPVPRFSPAVLDALQKWDWPGNIRELENWTARIVIFGTEEAIGLEFSRQLGARIDTSPRRHRATRINANRLRRTRRFS
jgi:DNA-binding NtrC family response regulator